MKEEEMGEMKHKTGLTAIALGQGWCFFIARCSLSLAVTVEALSPGFQHHCVLTALER